MTIIEQIESYCSKYKPIESSQDFIDKLCEADNFLYNKRKNAPKHVYDIFGRVYIYENDEDLKNIQLDEKTWEMTKSIVNILM